MQNGMVEPNSFVVSVAEVPAAWVSHLGQIMFLIIVGGLAYLFLIADTLISTFSDGWDSPKALQFMAVTSWSFALGVLLGHIS